MIFPTIMPQGYFLHLDSSPSAQGPHRFCGEHQIAGAECPNCRKPLLRLFSLDLRETPFQIETSMPVAHLLFCWRCELSQGPFIYQAVGEHEIRILHYRPGGRIPDFPYRDYPDVFPGASVTFTPISPVEQQVIELINQEQISAYDYEEGKYQSLGYPQHQVGGMPYLIQQDYWQHWFAKPCPLCGDDMPFLAEVADQCLDPRGFTSCWTQMLYSFCAKCHVFLVRQLCD